MSLPLPFAANTAELVTTVKVSDLGNEFLKAFTDNVKTARIYDPESLVVRSGPNLSSLYDTLTDRVPLKFRERKDAGVPGVPMVPIMPTAKALAAAAKIPPTKTPTAKALAAAAKALVKPPAKAKTPSKKVLTKTLKKDDKTEVKEVKDELIGMGVPSSVVEDASKEITKAVEKKDKEVVDIVKGKEKISESKALESAVKPIEGINEKTAPELKAIFKSLGYVGYSKLTKPQLVATLSDFASRASLGSIDEVQSTEGRQALRKILGTEVKSRKSSIGKK